MRHKLIAFIVMLLSVLVLAACGEDSPEKVLKDLNNKWNDVKGYELDATMEIKTGNEPRVYDVNVWHTEPDFYRVKVTQQGEDVTQMIIRNEEGVFVVTPSLRKTYKFQSEWPKQNSQAYLIGALAEDLLADDKVVMEEDEKNYIFTAATRNNHKSIMPTQKIVVDKKTMLPTSVSVLNEAEEEQMLISFKNIDLGMQHKESEYAVEKFSDDKDAKDTASADVEPTVFETHYPNLDWNNTKLIDEKTVSEDGIDRVILTFEGDKSFTLVQQPIVYEEDATLPVFAPGDPADLGFTIGAITDNSISWERDGVSFFIASDNLTKDEMMEVAASVTTGGLK
ncbi:MULTISPECIES: outer membrane lipoprotein carrier protein LolA [Lysinibacillus]|uniref:Outer membrane lipoprotein carrier protein LolA n=1 Tax=Lysinibacillus antri TaxID=2498145 RepID=A0A3S0P8H5_9BACI|nr:MULTISPECIES: outer membrane lipoprotein carrier protein LolA [Lysinibacillus]RUL53664.1 outer membrane lipoprotein carrier protein LolA [Lysinibacillus antri]TSI08068.1 outer membrane lipoprotein carrier protein LolA [Lysinibacillus sp. BW-2-10]